MRYKKGDTVRIKPKEWLKEHAEELNKITCVGFNIGMIKDGGKTCTVEKINTIRGKEAYYILEGVSRNWTDEMLESVTETNKSKYKEIFRLKEMLEISEIPFEFFENNYGFFIKYPNNEQIICSVIEHQYSYGNGEDLLELKGLLTGEEKRLDGVRGLLTAENVFERIQKHYYVL